jgi:GcrA cell cycle regulator
MSDAFDWNDAATRKIRDLWAEGHSTAEIGRRIGVSKNAVVGKAHRLDLPARPSPVRRGGHQAVIAPKRTPLVKRVCTLPSLAAAPVPASVTASNTVPLADTGNEDAAAPAPSRRSMARRDRAQCCWPIGEPGQPGFRFCDAPLVTRAPYCEAHARKAYARASSRRREGSEAMNNDR